MIKINILEKEEGLALFAKGPAKHNRTLKLSLVTIEDEQYMTFDNSDGEYGIGAIKLKDLKQLIDSVTKLGKEKAKLVGKLKQPYSVGSLLFDTGSEIFNSNNVYYLKRGKDVYLLSNPNIRELIDII